MASFEEVVEFAARQLDVRGLLLDRQLEPVAEGDKELLRKVRESLLAAKVAESRFGIGLARVGKSGVCLAALQDGRLQDDSQANSSNVDGDVWFDEDTSTAEWWVMSNGIVRGPWTIQNLVEMRVQNELQMSDLLRQGSRGMWIKPDEVTEVNEAIPIVVAQPPVPASTISNSVAEVESERSTSNSKLSDVEIESSDDQQLADLVTQRLRSRKQSSSKSRAAESPENLEADENCSETSANNHTGDKIPLQRAITAASIPVTQTSIQTQPAATRLSFSRDWRSWSLDALTTSLAYMIPGAFYYLFSSKGTGVLRFLLIAPLIVGALVGLTWYWPPSNAAMIREFEEVHAHVTRLKSSRSGEEQLIKELASDRARIQWMVWFLDRRATKEPSIDRELLLASKHALLIILDHPRNSDVFEPMYASHINQAKAILQGRPADTAAPKPPVAPVSTPLEQSNDGNQMGFNQPQSQ